MGWGVILLTMCGLEAAANVPAAYLACEGKADGDTCRYFGGLYGACIQDSACALPPDEDGVDRCIVCQDPCHDLPVGAECLQDDGGSPGVCQIQPQCTDDPETAFDECRYCFPPGSTPEAGEKDDGGCTAGGGEAAATLIWGLILGWGWRQRRLSRATDSPRG